MINGALFWPAERTDLLETMRTAARTAHPVPVEMVESTAALRLGAYDFLVLSDAHMDDAMVSSIRANDRLRWIQLSSSGSEQTLAADLPGRLTVTNAAVVWAPSVAEHAMALLLGLMRRIPASLQAQANRQWAPQHVGAEMTNLDGATVVVLGTGAVGREIAARLTPFHPTIVGVNRTGRDAGGALFHEYQRMDDLPTLLPRADVVLVCLPLRPTTRGLLGARELSALKPSCFLVNVARGQIVDAAALDEAVRTGRLAGVGLDVTEPEPLPVDSSLWTSERVILSPHVASQSGRPEVVGARLGSLVRDNAARVAEGRDLAHVVRAPTENTEES